MEAYCAKCRQKREMVDEVPTKTKRGGNGVKGKCGVCGTGMFIFTK